MSGRNYSVAETDVSKEREIDYRDHFPSVPRHSWHPAYRPEQSNNNEVSAGGHRLHREYYNGRQIDIIDWDGPNDPGNPFNWSKRYKWLATCTTCFISILTGLPAGAYGVAGYYMKQEWAIDEHAFPYLVFALVTWNMGAAVFPLIFVPMTESTGRMPGYWAAYILFVIWLIPSACSQNFATILVTRLFGGGCSSVAITLVSGTITDMWKGDRARSLPMSIFTLSGVAGIALGPLWGGAIQTHLSWRWIYWIQIIMDTAFLPIFYCVFSETRGDVVLAKRAKNLRKKAAKGGPGGNADAYARSELNKPSVLNLIWLSFMRPAKMLATESVVMSFTLWVSFAWGLLFLFQSCVPIVFGATYGFSIFQVALIQVAITVGALVATCLNPIQDSLYFKSAKRNQERPGKPIPEARLYFAVPGSILFSVSMIWFGWTSCKDVHWIAGTIALGAFGVGVYYIYLSATNYLADAYEKYAASALSAAGFGRNCFGAFLPLATHALYKNVGFQWASTMLGSIGLVLSLVPLVLLVKGPYLRARSPFMLESCNDDDEANERRESIAGMPQNPQERKGGAILPWNTVRSASVP